MQLTKYKLGDIADIFAGGDAPKGHMSSIKSSEFSIPIYSNGVENDGLYGYTDVARVSEQAITVSARGTIGVAFRRREPYFPIVRLISIIANPQIVDTDYLYYHIKFLPMAGEGSVQSQLTVPMAQNYIVSLPSLNEQKRIASVLSNFDRKIEINRQIIYESEAFSRQLYNYWFVQFDFPNLDGSPYKTSGGEMVYSPILKREIPKGWQVLKFKDCIEHINTGLNPRKNFKFGGDIKYITVKNLTTEGLLDFTGCDTIDEQARTKVHKRSQIEVGDILFASICPLGRTYLITSEPSDWDINESVFSIRPNVKYVTSQYLNMLLRDDFYVKKMTQVSSGSIFQGIRIGELENMPILVPNFDLMSKFSSKITPNLRVQNTKFDEINALTQQRNALLPLLMNGQVTVK